MATDLEKLMVRLEVSQRKFERQMQNISRTADRRSSQMQKRFAAANRNISKSFDRMGRSGVAALNGVYRAAALVTGALGVRELGRYADAWTRVENQIRSAEKISGTQARTTSELVDIANRGRAGLEETAELYSRLLRVSGNLGASEMEVAQATETVAKAFKAGGAAASEQAAGVLQLSQALASGFLQGDELRSLRENAPLIAQAIATEFETTIGGLKDLGAEGELTADRVFRAILNAQSEIEGAFSVTQATMADGFSVFLNGMMELIAAFDDGSGASSSFAEGLADVGEFLSDNAEAAERFGARVSEALTIFGEVMDGVKDRFAPVSEGFDTIGEDAAHAFTFIMDTIQKVVAQAVGVGFAIKTAMLNAVDAVASGAVGIANAAISAVDAILQKITDGINTLIVNVNSAISAVNSLGANIPTLDLISRQGLERVAAPKARGGDVGLAYREGYSAAFNTMQRGRDTTMGYIARIRNAGSEPGSTPGPDDGLRGGSTVPPKSPATSPSGGGSGRSGSGGSSRGETFAQVIEREKQALQDKIALIGLSEKATAKMEATQRLLAEAKKRGLDLDARQTATGQTLREEIDAQAEAIANLAEKYRQAEEQAQFYDDINTQLKDGLVDAIVEGENFAGVLADVAKALAKAALQAALFNEGPFSSGSGGGLLGSLFSGFTKALAGKRAMGGPVAQGKPYLVGERGPEIMVPSTSGKIIPNNRLGGGGVVVNYSPMIDARGADPSVLGRIEATLARDRAEFQQRAVAAVRQAQRSSVGGKL